MSLWQTIILHHQIDRKQGAKCYKDNTWNKVSCPDVSPTNQMQFCTNTKYASITPQQKLPCLLNIPTMSTSSLARLITWSACFVIVTCSCHHKSIGIHNIVTQHRVQFELNVSFPSHVPDSILHLCPWDHSSSRSRTRDTTRILGLNHGWNCTFVSWQQASSIGGEWPLGGDLASAVVESVTGSVTPSCACWSSADTFRWFKAG